MHEINRDTLEEVLYLTPENAVFHDEGNFLSLSLAKDEKQYSRVILRRAFPFNLPWQYICVTDTNEKEIGMIRDVTLFPAGVADLLRRELERFYYTPKIRAILSVKERYGFSYWEVKTDEGTASFTLKDTFRSLLRISEDRVAFFDVDGNRFEIESLSALDRKSYKKIELYL